MAVGFDFGLDWNHFNFCYVRELGEPLRRHFHSERERVNVYRQTAVVNNYRVTRTTEGGRVQTRVVNGGIDPARVTAVKGRAVEPVKIQDLRTPTPTRSHERLNPRTKTLEVYRPKLSDDNRR